MTTVHMFRGGAPDKGMFKTSDKIRLIKENNLNLVDLSIDEYHHYELIGHYLLPADEEDIKAANKLQYPWTKNGSNILLPKDSTGKVIPYYSAVPKNSIVYENLEKSTGIKYANYTIYDPIDEVIDEILCKDKCAIKTTTGSGSRGVLIIDKDNLKYGYKYREKPERPEIESLFEFARNRGASIMVQDLIPFNELGLHKINVDFIIRDGRLLSYKWDVVESTELFTNWTHLTILRSRYTDKIMNRVADYLIHEYDISDAIMNFEAFSNNEDITYLVEFNWRWSNSIFEYQAFNQDALTIYFDNIPAMLPVGEYKAFRYWQCILDDRIPNYNDWK